MKINSQNFTPMMKNGNSKNVKSESIFMADSFTRAEGQKSSEFFDPKCIGAANQKAGGNCDLGPCMGGANQKADGNCDLGPCMGGANEKAGNNDILWCAGGAEEKASEGSDLMQYWGCAGGAEEKAGRDLGPCVGGAEEKAGILDAMGISSTACLELNAKAGDAMEWNYCFGGGNEKAAGDVGLAWCMGAAEEKASKENKFDAGNISL